MGWLPLVAAAAALLVIALPRDGVEPLVHRDSTSAGPGAPRPIFPAGHVDSAAVLVWATVPDADLYRVRLFDGQGTMLLEREVTDTVVPVPPELGLSGGTRYYWRIDVLTGFDRWSSSELVEFETRR